MKPASPIWKDPIVEEIRARSERLAARFDFDIERLAEYYRKRQQEHPERVVDLSSQPREEELMPEPVTPRKRASSVLARHPSATPRSRPTKRSKPAAAAHRVRASKRP